MGVFTPGIGLAAFRNHAAETGIGDHIDPRRRRHLTGRGRNHVFAAIAGKTADAVVDQQLLVWQQAWRVVAAGIGISINHQLRYARRRQVTPVELFFQRAATVRQDHARHGQEQHPVFVGNLIDPAHENAARAVNRMTAGNR